MKKLILVITIVFLGFVQQVYAQGCAQCKLVAEQASELDESSFGTNINSGIFYLMLIPYFLLLFLFRNKIKEVIKMVFMKK